MVWQWVSDGLWRNIFGGLHRPPCTFTAVRYRDEILRDAVRSYAGAVALGSSWSRTTTDSCVQSEQAMMKAFMALTGPHVQINFQITQCIYVIILN